jgi:exodeoxyribonuclease VII large subunit
VATAAIIGSTATQSQGASVAELVRTTREGGNIAEFTVSELSNAIKRTLEGAYGYVRLRGEISGFRGVHGSGHCYFTLKDDKAKIDAVIWRTTLASLRVRPAEGLEVIAIGRVTTYPGKSNYQIVIDALQPAGIGALMALLEQRKQRLKSEGLFEDARKKALPFLPRVIGIVTSPTGAVIRDMLHGFGERFPVRVLLWPVRVQGPTSAAEVAAAIGGFNALAPDGPLPQPDLLIVARGGGSLEDLWSFNEEIVVRAVARSRIPLISAVGHETDTTLIDLAADARAPTPTKAAEWAVPRYTDLIQQTGELTRRLKTGANRLIEDRRTHLRAAARGLPRRQDLLAMPRQRFDGVEARLPRALLANTRAHAMHLTRTASRLRPRLLAIGLARARDRLDGLGRRTLSALLRASGPKRVRLERIAGRLSPNAVLGRLARGAERAEVLHGRLRRATRALLAGKLSQLEGSAKLMRSLSYHAALKRGFALLRDGAGRSIRSVGSVSLGQVLDIELADGHLGARAERVGAPPTAPVARPLTKPKSRPKSRDSGGQGSLF